MNMSVRDVENARIVDLDGDVDLRVRLSSENCSLKR